MNRVSWDVWALNGCEWVSERSKDPSHKVGSIILRPDRTVASVGYNGFPRGVSDDEALYENKDLKRMRVVHAEVNAILSAKETVKDCTLYVSPLCPCAACAGVIIQAGIKRVVYRQKEQASDKWQQEFVEAKQLFKEAGVLIQEERELNG